MLLAHVSTARSDFMAARGNVPAGACPSEVSSLGHWTRQFLELLLEVVRGCSLVREALEALSGRHLAVVVVPRLRLLHRLHLTRLRCEKALFELLKATLLILNHLRDVHVLDYILAP